MPDEFDVFLSHSAKDKAVVRPLAERLRKDGQKVWPVPPKRLRVGGFDEWEIHVAASRQSATSFVGGMREEREVGGTPPRRRDAESVDVSRRPTRENLLRGAQPRRRFPAEDHGQPKAWPLLEPC